jgi:hypothetical protein
MEDDAILIRIPNEPGVQGGTVGWKPTSGGSGGSVAWPPHLGFHARIAGKHSGSVLHVAITVDGKPVLSRSHQGAGAVKLTSQQIRKAIKSAPSPGELAFEIRVDEAKAGR